MEISFNNKAFTDTFTFGQKTIPPALIDVINEIKNYNPKIYIDSLNHDMAVGLYSEAFNNDQYWPPTISVDWRGMICTVMVIIADIYGGPWGSVGIAIVNYLFFV
jgi:hypothetical protein